MIGLCVFSDDVEFILSFIPICEKFDFTSQQEETIYSQ